MTDFEAKVRTYYALRPTDYFVLQSLTLAQGTACNGVFEQSLTLILKKDAEASAGTLHLQFYGIRKLIFRQPDWSQISVGHVEILALASTTEGGGNFLVRDSGQDRVLGFECRDFDAKVV